MKKSKRILAAALTAVLLLTGLCGCSSNHAETVKLDKDHPVNIDIWHYYNGAQKMHLMSLSASLIRQSAEIWEL